MNRILMSLISLPLLASTSSVLAWQPAERYQDPYYGSEDYLYRAEQPYGYRQGVDQRPGIRIEKTSDADGYLLRIYTKGMNPEDIAISTGRGRIRLEATTQAWRNWQDGQRTARASAYGRFSRTLRLPRDADAAGLETRITDGLLEIRIPRW